MGSLEDYETNGHSDDQDSTKTIDMALYSLHRAHATLSSLRQKPKWSICDTASFDCMHYDGDTALDHLATKLNLQLDQRILDVGSGFSATGRVLCSKYDVLVTGVELQREVHELAEVITGRNEDAKVRKGVSSVCADFLTVNKEELGGQDFDHVVSLLCILHLPQESRRTFFNQAAQYLKPGSKIYIEDFYQQGNLSDLERNQLRNIVACSYLPTKDAYIADVEAAGLVDVEFDNVSKHWTALLVARAKQYKTRRERDAGLEMFYDTMAELFQGGNIGGVRLVATKR